MLIALLFAWASAAEPDLTGTWRVDLHLVHDVRVPMLGHSRSDSYTVQLWQVRDGAMRNQHCSIRVATRNPIGKPRMPDAFFQNIPSAAAPISLEGDRFRVDLGVGRVGFVGDVVPTEASDPAVRDHEGDGQPGATIYVWAPLFGEVAVYIVQRTRILLDGVVADGRVSGQATQVDLTQHTIGAANRLFNRQPVLTPVPEESGFTMVRVDASTTCADAVMASK